MAASMKNVAKTICSKYVHFRCLRGIVTIPNMELRNRLDTNAQKIHMPHTAIGTDGHFFHLAEVERCSKQKRSFCSTSSSHNHRSCWNCGSKTDSETELFFCNCGVIQTVPSDLTLFRAMGFEEEFDLDTSRLSELYKSLQRNLHPDKFTLKSKEEQDLAVDQSAFINKAYWTLVKPLSRGLYLLELQGDPVEETNTSVDPDFLMEMMEVNEDIAEARGDQQALETLETINRARMDKCVMKVSKAFTSGDTAKAKRNLIKLKYFTNIDDKIKEIYWSQMDH